MGQVPHGCATTTEAIRRAIQNSQESLRALSKRYGINPKTVAKWKKRGSVVDLPTGPKEPESTSLSLGDEAIIVAFRQHTLLPLDDCLYALQATIPHLTRSSLHRCLQRHGISRLPDVEDGKGIKRKFKAYPIGYGYLEFVRRGLLGAFAELDKIMPRKPGATLDLSEAEQKIVDVFRRSFEGEKGSEPLYVASFARGKTEDHDNRGMLTLWDRYTKLEGYCLQFREEDVRRIIELEASSRHYAFLTLDHVHYGMDESTSEYRELAFQMNQLLMIEVLKGMPTLPIEPASPSTTRAGPLMVRGILAPRLAFGGVTGAAQAPQVLRFAPQRRRASIPCGGGHLQPRRARPG
jgi:hypothetical protein